MLKKTLVTLLATTAISATLAGSAQAAVDPACAAGLQELDFPMQCVDVGSRKVLRLDTEKFFDQIAQDSGDGPGGDGPGGDGGDDGDGGDGDGGVD